MSFIDDKPLEADYTSRPVGSFWGGRHPYSLACPRCGKPGVLISVRKRGPLDVWQVAHHATTHVRRADCEPHTEHVFCEVEVEPKRKQTKQL